MAIIYQFVVDPDRFRYFDLVDPTYSDKFSFDGHPYARQWEPPKLYVQQPKKKEPDIWTILPLTFSAFVLNDRALKVLTPALGEGNELLPVKCEVSNFTIVNILGLTDCLDRENADFDKDAPGHTIYTIYKYAFLMEKIKTQLFKMPRQLGVFVVSGLVPPERDFKNLIETNGLKGARFVERWNSDTANKAI